MAHAMPYPQPMKRHVRKSDACTFREGRKGGKSYTPSEVGEPVVFFPLVPKPSLPFFPFRIPECLP